MSITWLEPWLPIEHSNERAALEGELKRELSGAHPLFGLLVIALAKRREAAARAGGDVLGKALRAMLSAAEAQSIPRRNLVVDVDAMHLM